ncbi:MAG: protein adenylyltransferase SelO family protein, partial [Nocardioides sp.]
AVLARVAASHLRVGSFQFARATGDLELLRRLIDHSIARHHPTAATAENPAMALFDAVVGVQAELVAHWMSLGFVHGVMNTDNVTISGETIDYGPCAFLDTFDPGTVFSSIDEGGRYAYGNQPAITEWNLARLAEALLPAIADDEQEAIRLATEALQGYRGRYGAAWSTRMHAKLGIARQPDDSLVTDLLELMHTSHVDFTSFFRALGTAASGDADDVRGVALDLPDLDAWLERWQSLAPDAAAMSRVNPVYIPRNHLVEQALNAATEGELGPFEQLLDVVLRPFDARPGLEAYATPAPADFGQYVTYCGT